MKIAYTLVSDTPVANRHMLVIHWPKAQTAISLPESFGVESAISSFHFVFKMTSVAAPDPEQSKSYIATAALFSIFSSSKEDKASMKLPSVWRELWSELADVRKSQIDAHDRLAVKQLRTLVRQKQDQELEDGVLLQGAFKGRINNRNPIDSSDGSTSERSSRQAFNSEFYQNTWANKSDSSRFQAMLVSCLLLVSKFEPV